MLNDPFKPTEALGVTKLPLTAPVQLEPNHDFGQFDCGVSSINDYAKTALKNQTAKNAVVYVSCIAGTNVVKAFYTLSNGSIVRSVAPKAMQRNSPDPLPVTILGRMGVDVEYKGLGIGKDILQDALERSILASRFVASKAILVHALDDRLADFYAKNAGFKPSPIGSLTLFLSLM